MAKSVITLEDNGDRVTLSLEGSGPILGRTRAQHMAVTLFHLAEMDARISQVPACRRQPPSELLH